jgi:hypothetical protein
MVAPGVKGSEDSEACPEVKQQAEAPRVVFHI